MSYDRARIMRDAHREWRATKHRPGMTFGKCLALAWRVEKQRVAGPVYYNPAPFVALPSGERDFIRL